MILIFIMIVSANNWVEIWVFENFEIGNVSGVSQHATIQTLSVFYDNNKTLFQNETFSSAPRNSKKTIAEKISRIEKLCKL